MRYTEGRPCGQFVVLDQPEPAASRLEHRGPVVVRGREPLVVPELRPAGVRHDLVGEAGRKGEETVRVVDERRERAALLNGTMTPATLRAGFGQ